MQIEKHKVVSIDYTLKDNDGQLIDSSEQSGPLSYLHGEGNVIPGLERALEGKAIGDRVEGSILPTDGFGERVDDLRRVVSRESFGGEDLEIGMRFRVPADDEGFLAVTVVEFDDETVTIDGNHILAGVTINFDVTVQRVRDATSEEISHGHARSTNGDS